MDSMQVKKNTVLIADDSEMNRSILADMLGDEYEIIEAENGSEAISKIKLHSDELSLILLDIVMPEADGFDVLEEMNRNGWIEKIPVIMISSENRASSVERAYELGVTDFISRPFDALIVHRRVINTILLYTKQKKLIELAAKQIYENERQSRIMIEILSHIVEFRNGESGSHVRKVRYITELLLNTLTQRSSKYQLSQSDISTISTASALHDIGKIAIAENILNKPGPLTSEEFEIIKGHSVIGARILSDLHIQSDDRLIKYAYEICRWHHERYDGKGYPDGLKGDEIPISAQIVALADVYDALTSDRVYKKAYSHDKAIKMIIDGECGKFNPLLIECLIEVKDELSKQLDINYPEIESTFVAQRAVEEFISRDENLASKRTLQLLENERMKFDSFASLTNDIQFEYYMDRAIIKLSPFSAALLELPETISLPSNDQKLLSIISSDEQKKLFEAMKNTSPENNELYYDCKLNIAGEKRWFRFVIRTLWQGEEKRVLSGAIGKAIDIHDSRAKLKDLEKRASTDGLTGILNHSGAKKLIKAALSDRSEKKYALAIFDLDRFKQANDSMGHMFGDKVLVHTAQKLRQSMRGSDIIARVGGDEFLIFLEYKTDLDLIIKRIFGALTGKYEDFQISLSMGIATTETVGYDYDDLFCAADKALYSMKRTESGKYRFYDESIHEIFSVISPIES